MWRVVTLETRSRQESGFFIAATRLIEASAISLKGRATEAAKQAQSALIELNQLRGESLTTKIKVEPIILAFGPLPPTDLLLSRASTNNFS